MKTWYCVTTTFDNRGRVTAAVTDICNADSKPENTFLSTSRKDIYNDWFATRDEAESFVAEAKNA